MLARLWMRCGAVVLSGAALYASAVGCGASTNLNQIWGPNDEASDGLLLEARAAYDRGDFDDAEKLASKLLDRNPDNEAAAVLLGYVYLSLGGIDPYRLARELGQLSTASKTADSATGGSGLIDDATTTCKSTGAASTLQQLGGLINLTEDDFTKLSAKIFDTESNGGKAPKLFGTDNPLIVPAKVSAELRESVDVLRYMDKAVASVCRFVNAGTDGEGVRVDDGRDNAENCAPTENPRLNKAKAHFLWAFSHLTEALVYQSVLLYSTASSAEDGCSAKRSNFEVASESLNNGKFTGDDGFLDFIDQVGEVKNAVDAVYDTVSEDSMIRQTLLDLNAVNKAFAVISGLPDQFKERISKALEQLDKVGGTVGADNPVAGNTKALKGEMTEKLAGTVGKQVDKVIDQKFPDITYEEIDDSPAIPDADKDKIKGQFETMCGAYDNLAEGVPAEKIKRPAGCKGV